MRQGGRSMTDTDLWDWTGLANVGAGTVVIIIVISILRGWLVPRRVMQDRMSDKDRSLADVRRERDLWRSAAQAKDATIAVQARQFDELYEAARVTRDILSAIPKAVKDG